MSSIRVLSFLFVALLSQSEISYALKILGIFPLAQKSHFASGGALMKELALRGHEVDVISAFPQKKPVPNYRDITIESPLLAMTASNITYKEGRKYTGMNMAPFMKLAATDACDLLAHPNIQKVLRTRKGHYDVIVVEMFVAHCYLAFGQHLNAPVVANVACKMYDWLVEPFGSPLNPSYAPSVFAPVGQPMTFWERVVNTIVMNAVNLQVNYLMEAQKQHVQKYFGRKLSSIRELYDDVSLTVVNSHNSINDIKPLTPDIIEVGGLHLINDEQQLPPDLQKWLDEATSGCILFTFGSMIRFESFPPEIIKIFYEAFDRIAPMRVLIKIVDPSILPPGLPKNVRMSDWLPQLAILKHKNVKLFITHGGLLGIQEAVAYKVPMIGFPFFADQLPNMYSCVKKKIAIALTLAKTTPDSLTKAIKTVLTDPTYRNNVERVSKLFWDRPKNPLDTAVYWVEYAARHGKILKSPATKLTWWQLHLLDVYGFILCSILLSLYLMKKILGVLVRHIRSERNIDRMKKRE